MNYKKYVIATVLSLTTYKMCSAFKLPSVDFVKRGFQSCTDNCLSKSIDCNKTAKTDETMPGTYAWCQKNCLNSNDKVKVARIRQQLNVCNMPNRPKSMVNAGTSSQPESYSSNNTPAGYNQPNNDPSQSQSYSSQNPSIGGNQPQTSDSNIPVPPPLPPVNPKSPSPKITLPTTIQQAGSNPETSSSPNKPSVSDLQSVKLRDTQAAIDQKNAEILKGKINNNWTLEYQDNGKMERCSLNKLLLKQDSAITKKGTLIPFKIGDEVEFKRIDKVIDPLGNCGFEPNKVIVTNREVDNSNASNQVAKPEEKHTGEWD